MGGAITSWQLELAQRIIVSSLECGLAMQDAIKKQAGDQLPDFYNIVLERPRDDPAGYDVLFIDAASKVMALVRCAMLFTLQARSNAALAPVFQPSHRRGSPMQVLPCLVALSLFTGAAAHVFKTVCLMAWVMFNAVCFSSGAVIGILALGTEPECAGLLCQPDEPQLYSKLPGSSHEL